MMTHASSARQLTARTKTANVMGSDTIAVAVDRRDGPAFIEDRPYGRPIRSSPWPWPLTPSRRAASPATTASRSESHRQGGLDTVRPWAAATHGGCGRRGWRKRHRGVDQAGVIRVHTLTEETGGDATIAIDRLTAVKGPLVRVTADAASDTVAIDETARARGATVVVPPARTANVSGHGPRSLARDRTIPWVETLGRCRWKQVSGFHRQGRVENTCFRDTSIIGESLRARSPARQGSAVVLGCEILNRDDRTRPTRVISPRQMRILSVGIVRTRHDSCNNAPDRPHGRRPARAAASPRPREAHHRPTARDPAAAANTATPPTKLPTPPPVASGAGGGPDLGRGARPERPTRIAGSSAAHGPLKRFS